MKSPVLTFSSDKHAPTLWASVQISTAALASINKQAALIRYRDTDQPILTIPGTAAQAGALGSVSFAGHGASYSGCGSGCDSCSAAAFAAAAATAAF
jgi:hypothetical protein